MVVSISAILWENLVELMSRETCEFLSFSGLFSCVILSPVTLPLLIAMGFTENGLIGRSGFDAMLNFAALDALS